LKASGRVVRSAGKRERKCGDRGLATDLWTRGGVSVEFLENGDYPMGRDASGQDKHTLYPLWLKIN
jgi:hypothetical protein